MDIKEILLVLAILFILFFARRLLLALFSQSDDPNRELRALREREEKNRHKQQEDQKRQFDTIMAELPDVEGKELFQNLQQLKDYLAIPEELWSILRDYGRVLENLPKESKMIHPLSKLPHPKEEIESTLKTNTV